MSEAPQIRPARREDVEAVAAILVEGFHEIFAAAFAQRFERAEAIVAQTLALELSRGLPSPYVAVVEGQIAGTLAVRRRGTPEPPAFSAAGILFRELGLWGGIRAIVHFSLFDQPIGRQEAYVSDVAVHPSFRRQGVAQALMRHAEAVARRWRKNALVLDVSAENEKARALYRGLGYAEERIRRSLLSRWLLGKGRWVRMRKEMGP